MASTHLGSGRPKRAELSVPPVLPAAPGDFRRQPSRPLCPSWHPTWFLEESVLTREQVGAAFKYFGAGELAPGANDYSPLGEDYAVTATATAHVAVAGVPVTSATTVVPAAVLPVAIAPEVVSTAAQFTG